MMRRRSIPILVLAALALLLVLAAPAHGAEFNRPANHDKPRTAMSACDGRFQSFTVVNEVGVPDTYLAKVERAVAAQSVQVAGVWHSSCARFVPSGGEPVYIVARVPALSCGTMRCNGVHTTAGDAGGAAIWVATWGGWTVALSHEALEEVVGREVCDPVADTSYALDSVWVSDWTLPAYWRGDWSARWDWLGRL